MNTSVSLNSLDITALTTTVSTGFLARYLKTEVDALLATINTNKNLKVNATDYTTGLATKQNTISGLLVNVLSSTLTAYKVLVTNSNGKLATSLISTTELDFCIWDYV